MEDDKRVFPRVVSVNLVSYKQSDGFEEISSLGRTRNLSKGGILLEVKQHFPLSSVIELQIALGEDIVRPTGRVVRLQELKGNLVEMGIEFTEMSEDDRRTLDRYITKR